MRFATKLCLMVLMIARVVSAAPLEHDLGKGLVYFRITEATPGLPQLDANRSAVLDLRYTGPRAVAEKALTDWLQRQATPQAPVFVLANAQTAPELLAILARLAPQTRLLVIGPATASFAPDIVISISAKAELTAYHALQAGTEIASLISPITAKTRHDEAAILAARSRGESLTEEIEPELTDETAPDADSPPVDLALQRAVQIHRAWLILGSKQP